MLMAECLGFLHRLAEVDNVELARKMHLQSAIRNEVPDIQNIKIDTIIDSTKHQDMYRDNLNPSSYNRPSNLGLKVSIPDESLNQLKRYKPSRSIRKLSKDLSKLSESDNEISKVKPSRHTKRVGRQRRYRKTSNRLKNKVMTPESQRRSEIMLKIWANKKAMNNQLNEDHIRISSNDQTSMKEDEISQNNTKDKADNKAREIERKTSGQILKKTLKHQTNEIKRASRPYRKRTMPGRVLKDPRRSEMMKKKWAEKKFGFNNRVKKVKALDDEAKYDRIQKSQFFR